MSLLIRVEPHLEAYVTEVALGWVSEPPGEGWSISAVIEGRYFLWTRSKILGELRKQGETK